MEERLKQLEAELQQEREAHTANVGELERRNVAEKNRLKKEMLRKVKETKLSLLAMTEDQLHTTTKRTIMENEQMTIELQYQSKVTEKLLKKNKELMEKNKELKRNIELQSDAERMLVTRTHFFQKLIAKLNDKVKNMESNQCMSESRLGKREQEMLEHLHFKDETVEALEIRLGELEDAYSRVEGDKRTMEREMNRMQKASEQMLLLQDEAVTFLLTCLEDARQQIADEKFMSSAPLASKVSKSLNSPKRLVDVSPQQREKVLKVFLQRLQQNQAHSAMILQSADGSGPENFVLPKI